MIDILIKHKMYCVPCMACYAQKYQEAYEITIGTGKARTRTITLCPSCLKDLNGKIEEQINKGKQ